MEKTKSTGTRKLRAITPEEGRNSPCAKAPRTGKNGTPRVGDFAEMPINAAAEDETLPAEVGKGPSHPLEGWDRIPLNESDPLTLPEGWAPGKFSILTPDGMTEMEGFIRPPFGVDRRSANAASESFWVVTHLPTGRALQTRIEAFEIATDLVRRILPLTDWNRAQLTPTLELKYNVEFALRLAYSEYVAKI
jgi:hypothetical protein